MSDTNQEQEDAVLRRMLAMKPQPHKPIKEKRASKLPAKVK